ncbi:hypothetical protein [Streptomyces sp. NPDC005890]|uniref:hypothetical protein n=1 Tax=Streptomyces sp. NPDC005890 TaxID=3154568 RepID=UPI0033F5E896
MSWGRYGSTGTPGGNAAEQTRKALGIALDWLEPRHTDDTARFYPTHRNAGGVLPSALNRPDLAPGQAQACVDSAHPRIAAAAPADERVPRLRSLLPPLG